MNLEELKPLVALGILALLLLWESLAPFFVFPRGKQRCVHGARNVLLGVGNALLNGLVFTGLWWAAAGWSSRHGIGLLHWLAWPALAQGILAVVLLDAWTYAWHRMNHRVPFLWRFHRVHHSDPHMDATTASRFHVGEMAMSSLLRLPLIILLGLEMEHLAIYEVLMFAVVQFHHANVSIGARWDRWLSWIIVTPFMHKVHHSRWQPETDSNYSSLLSVWDRLFRSFRRNAAPASLRMGLDDFADARSQTLTGMLGTPLAPRHPSASEDFPPP